MLKGVGTARCQSLWRPKTKEQGTLLPLLQLERGGGCELESGLYVGTSSWLTLFSLQHVPEHHYWKAVLFKGEEERRLAKACLFRIPHGEKKVCTCKVLSWLAAELGLWVRI